MYQWHDLSENYFFSVKGLGQLGNESFVWDWKWSVWLRRSRNRKPYGKGLRRGCYINSYFMILQSKFLSVALVHESREIAREGEKESTVYCITAKAHKTHPAITCKSYSTLNTKLNLQFNVKLKPQISVTHQPNREVYRGAGEAFVEFQSSTNLFTFSITSM